MERPLAHKRMMKIYDTFLFIFENIFSLIEKFGSMNKIILAVSLNVPVYICYSYRPFVNFVDTLRSPYLN